MHFLLYLTANDFVQDEFCYENQSFINLRLEQNNLHYWGGNQLSKPPQDH